jgi:hypothetical protein
MLLRDVGFHLYERRLHRVGRRGVLLHEHLHEWHGAVPVGDHASKLRHRERLHDLDHDDVPDVARQPGLRSVTVGCLYRRELGSVADAQ